MVVRIRWAHGRLAVGPDFCESRTMRRPKISTPASVRTALDQLGPIGLTVSAGRGGGGAGVRGPRRPRPFAGSEFASVDPIGRPTEVGLSAVRMKERPDRQICVKGHEGAGLTVEAADRAVDLGGFEDPV